MYLKKRINALVISMIMLLVCMAIPVSFAIKGSALTEYENYLSSQGFPESYWPNLEALHDQYPQWIFKAQNVGLNWDDVVSAESSVGKNLVSKYSLDSWKSFEYGAYDFSNKDWVSFDSGSWVSASREIITYYLDPRNFINSSTIFMFLNQSYDSSTQTIDGVHKIVSGTFMDSSFPESGYSSYSDVIMEAANESGVNPYVLASSIVQEQGTSGSSDSISGTYPGYEGIYNYFNDGAYADTITINGKPVSMTAVQRGLWWAAGAYITNISTSYNRPWNSRAKAIIGGAIYYGSNYVSIGQNNLYFKKFNVVHKSYYTHQYMTNVQAAESEAKNLKKAYANMMDMNYTFNIPVYSNMPDSAAVKPTADLNNDNLLSSLSVDGYSLTPTFTTYGTSYDLIVDKDTHSIHINASTIDSGASITSPTTVSLNDGDNDVPVVVRAPSGVERTYTLNVYKEPSPVEPTTTSTTETTTVTETPTTETPTTAAPTTAATTTTTTTTAPQKPVVSSSSYTIGSGISNIKPDTSADSFLGNLSVSNGNAVVVDSSGNAKSGNLATGDKVQILQNGSIYETYEISVNGDINGDGKLTVFDILKVQDYILKKSSLSGTYLSSADYNKDGNVNILDLLLIQQYILGK